MFIGKHEVAVDPKGRIHLPSKVRDVLLHTYEAPLILTISDRCLVGFPSAQWKEKIQLLDEAPYTPENGDLLRFLTENATVTPLKNGRILIPADLREHAGIERDAVIVGRLKKIEIWSAQRHMELTAGISSAELSKRLRELGF